MNFKDNESVDKLRGGYYTEPDIAYFLTKWILHNKPKTVLEPSCGDGAFLRSFKGQHRYKINLTAIELLKEEAIKAEKNLHKSKSLNCEIINEDFLEYAIDNIDKKSFDAVLGNPPYIRYQYLESHSQVLAKEIFDKYNLKFTKHTNAWVPFIIASVALLNAGGRLGMVIPSEILHVLHARPLREYLLESCGQILMIDPTKLLFKDALQGTVLLMVEKKKKQSQKSKGVAILSAPDNSFLEKDPEDIFKNANYISGDVLNGKWMKVMLSSEELDVYEKARALSTVHKFSSIASVDVGIVTGANKFFLVNNDTIKEYNLKKYAHPMFGRSEHCKGLIYDEETHKHNQKLGLPTNFLMFDDTVKEKLPKKVREYIDKGEEEDLHKRYKCRIRKPWFKVPSIYSTEIGMLKRSNNYPKMILNSVEAYTTDTAYRIRVINDSLQAENLVYCFINSLTALSAELEGRHYGGGVLELVPSEIEKLLIPLPDITPNLESLNKQIKLKMNAEEVLCQQNKIVLTNIGLSENDIAILHKAWKRIKYRRHRTLE